MKPCRTLSMAAVLLFSGQLLAADAINLSSRANVGLEQEKLNTSVVVVGSGSTEFLAKAVGPSMAASGVQGTLQDPMLKVVDLQSMTVIAEVDDWQDDSDMADRLTSLGLAPKDPKEAATIVSLSAGSYSVQVTGSGNTTGIGQASIRELSFSSMPTVSAFNGVWQCLDPAELSLQITAGTQGGGEYMIATVLESLPSSPNCGKSSLLLHQPEHLTRVA